MMGEIQEEWKNSIVTPIYKKGYKQNMENYGGINLLNTCYKLYSKILNDKLKAQKGKFLLECQNGFRKAHLASIHSLAQNYLQIKDESLISKPT